MAMVVRNWLSGGSNLDEDLKLMRNKAQTLSARAADITTEVTNAERHPAKKRKGEVHDWMEKAKDLKSRMDRIEEEVEQGSSGSDLRTKTLNIIKEIEELLNRAAFQNGVTIHDLESSSLPLLTTGMKGQQFENNLTKILSWLLNDEVYKIGVYGVGGVGKTTLATHVHNQLLSVLGKSATVCWVTVSQKCTIWELQRKIAKELNLPCNVLEEADEKRRPAILSLAIESKRGNVVVILDDMWDDFALEEVGLPTGENGCKLLLTSRSLEVCRRMECKKSVNVESLSEEESWILFTEKLGNYDDLSLEAKDVAKSVARECGGLPLGIIVVAASMRGIYDVCEWNKTFEDLKDPTRIHEGMKDKVFPSLLLSFDQLNNVMLQNCFLSCALYPEDWIFKRADLVNHWIMEGHLEEIQTWQKRMDMAYTMCNKLVSACLLEALKPGNHVKMHDLIRDMAIGILSQSVMIKAGMHLKEVPRLQEWKEELTKVSLIDNYISEIPSGMAPRCPNLSSLLLNRSRLITIPDSFFYFLKGLKFLDLSETWIKRLPNSISYLENLTALHLKRCEKLDYIPSLAKLTKLRHLDLNGCLKLAILPRGMEELVNLECLNLRTDYSRERDVSFIEFVTKLSNLQCLELNYCVKGIQIRGMQQLGRLERLTGFNIQDKDNFNKYIKSKHFRQLTSYQLLLGDWSDSFYFDERSICINSCPDIEDGAVQLPDNTRQLSIEDCKFKLRNLVDALPSLVGLTRLASFYVIRCRGIECIWLESSCAKPALENLEMLILDTLHNLRALAIGRVVLPPGSFSNLKELRVYCCDKMEKVFTPCMLKGQLQNLEVIEIVICKELEEIFAGSEVNEESGEVNPVIMELPKLRLLILKDLPKLKMLFAPCLLKGQLQHLNEIEIAGSELDADAIEDSGEVNPLIMELPKLSGLCLERLPKLASICQTRLICCKTIEDITVFECPELKKWPLALQVPAPSRLRRIEVESQWWESLTWDNPLFKPTFPPFLPFISSDSDSDDC